MRREFVVTYSKELCRTAAGRFWWCWFGWRTLIELAAGALLLALAVPWLPGWLAGALSAILIVYAATAVAGYWMQRRRLLALLQSMGDPEARVTLADDHLAIDSGAGRAEVPWSMVRRVKQFPDLWLLFWTGGSFSTLPASQLDDEGRAFVVQKVRQAGGQVD